MRWRQAPALGSPFSSSKLVRRQAHFRCSYRPMEERIFLGNTTHTGLQPSAWACSLPFFDRPSGDRATRSGGAGRTSHLIASDPSGTFRRPTTRCVRRTLSMSGGSSWVASRRAPALPSRWPYMYAPKGTEANARNLNLEKGRSQRRELDGLMPPYNIWQACPIALATATLTRG